MDQTEGRLDPVAGSSAGPDLRKNFLIVTAIGACAASLSAWLVTSLSMPLWVMFTGFIAWYSRPISTRTGIGSVIALWLGMGLAPIASTATSVVAPLLGSATLPASVFVVTALIVGVRAVPFVGNILCWFLGFVTFSAAAHSHTPAPLLTLVAASAVGGIAAWACWTLSARFEAAHQTR